MSRSKAAQERALQQKAELALRRRAETERKHARKVGATARGMSDSPPSVIEPVELSKEDIERVARQVSSGPIGLAHYRPEPGARILTCLENVREKVERSGGRACYGWTFSPRRAIAGAYLSLTHHAVWNAPDGSLVDVTPRHPDPAHQPLMVGTSTLFLVDVEADPIVLHDNTGKEGHAPRPSNFFPLDDSTELGSYLAALRAEEERDCSEMYERVKAGTYTLDPITEARDSSRTLG